MHELSLMKGLLHRIEEIAREHQPQRIVRLKVTLGALSHLSPEHFRQHFEEAVRGTPAEGAELEIGVVADLSDPRAQQVILESADLEGA